MILSPSFWFKKKSLPALILTPLAWIYQSIHKARWRWVRPTIVATPIVCIGNTGIGGAGKTPTAIALGKILIQLSVPFVYLSRGYGGKALGPLLVNPHVDKAEEVGDEPILLSHVAPTIVSKNRPRGLSLLYRTKAKTIIMDDGYQNPSLQKKVHILVVDGRNGFGNEKVFPAGPLREPLSMSFGRASCVVVLGTPSSEAKKVLETYPGPSFQGKLVLKIPENLPSRIYAFAGIAFPSKFFHSLKDAGFSPVGTKAFPDHAPYTETDITILRREAAKLNAQLVTTEKDYVRLSLSQRKHVIPLEVFIQWKNEKALTKFLKEQIVP